MATTATFSNMLNEFVNEELLFNELVKRDWMMSNLEQEKNWLGGSYIIPFIGAVGSSVAFGSLTASSDIAISTGLLAGNIVSKLTADGDASGNITVADPERFAIGMKVYVDDDNSAASAAGYVRTIDLNTGVLVIYDARTGGAVINLSAYTVAQSAVVYADGQQANGFASLKKVLLSSANGGDATYGGVTKASYPHMQAINIDGSSITATNILTKIFDAYVTVRKRGSGKPFKVIMSYKNFGSCLKSLESAKGSFNVMPGSSKTSVYGWDEVTVGGFAGALSLVAVQEMADS